MRPSAFPGLRLAEVGEYIRCIRCLLYTSTFIHPFNDAEVIAGQGTVGLEILDQLPDVEVVLVPVGGGGLISGVAYAIKHLHPECKVYGVQAAGAPSMRDSVQKHEAITLDGVATLSLIHI